MPEEHTAPLLWYRGTPHVRETDVKMHYQIAHEISQRSGKRRLSHQAKHHLNGGKRLALQAAVVQNHKHKIASTQEPKEKVFQKGRNLPVDEGYVSASLE